MHKIPASDPRRLDLLIAPGSPATWRRLGSQSLQGRCVLITGAGGSIGSALAHAVSASIPSSLILLDSSEQALRQVEHSLHKAGSHAHLALTGDICDANTLDQTLSTHRPEIIFHAAALKHVPLMEREPFAAIATNVFGTLALIHSAVAHSVQQVVHVSTDKAVNPRSIMGASKRIAEHFLLAQQRSTSTKAVRLCNVMGSQGSVLPLFLQQIDHDGPVTVTDPDAQRYFMTMDETVQALVDALDVHSKTSLLLPRIDPAVRIVDLARHLIASKRSPATIQFTGLRPGDKLSEQLIGDAETLLPTPAFGRSGLSTIDSPLPAEANLTQAMNSLRDALETRDLQALLTVVQALVPGYRPSSVLLAACTREPALALATGFHA